MLALAKAMEGMSRAEAARAAGIERQALRDAVLPLRDAVLRFNAEGLAGLVDRPYGRRPERQVECRMTDSLRASATRAFPGPTVWRWTGTTPCAPGLLQCCR